MSEDIRQIVDLTKPTTIYFSGVEYKPYFDGCYNMGVRNFLMSYQHCKGKGLEEIKAHDDIHLMVDSGAYTYINDPRYSDYSVDEWEKHIDAYLTWVRKHSSTICAIAELDLQDYLGINTITRWRHDFFEPFMLETNIPVIFLHHFNEDESWEALCERYPYVGFPPENQQGLTDEATEQHASLLKIAEKYNTLVHGFGMTKTRRLHTLPYYSVDSTSWKYGFMYHKIAMWDATAHTLFMVRADRWDDKIKPTIDSYPDIAFDEQKLKTYDEPELLKANVYAYLKAQEYIRERLAPRAYWLRQRTKKVNLDTIDEDFFPSVEYFQNATAEQNREYARKMNINPEVSNLADLLYDVTAFCNWDNPKYATMREWYEEEENASTIDGLHTFYINRVTPDRQDKIRELVGFYKACVSGDNDKLLYLETNHDRLIKERDDYITEEEVILEDVSMAEIHRVLDNILPAAEQTEVATDKILKETGIVPVRDEDGTIIKGVRAKKAPKKIYSNKMPKFSCDTCQAALKCPEYKAGCVCAYNKLITDKFDMRNISDVKAAMQSTVEYSTERLNKAMIAERLNGGIDPNVSRLIAENINYMQLLFKLNQESSGSIRQTREYTTEGIKEETVVTNPQGGSVLEQIIKSAMTTDKPKKNEDEVDALVREIDAE